VSRVKYRSKYSILFGALQDGRMSRYLPSPGGATRPSILADPTPSIRSWLLHLAQGLAITPDPDGTDLKVLLRASAKGALKFHLSSLFTSCNEWHKR